MRKAAVAGQFYPDDEEELKLMLKECVSGEGGQGVGGVVPHAGYMYSGKGMGLVYDAVEWPEVFVILGVNHRGLETCTSDEDWETPLGVVSVDKEIVSRLGIPVNNRAHAMEHSIEVQLPFIQYISDGRDVKIVPIMIADDEYEKWGSLIKKACFDKKVCFLASSDFTHYGNRFGYVPFDEDVASRMKKLDMGAINFVEKADAAGFLGYVEEKKATICGKYGIAVLCWLMKGKKGKCIGYYTSGDVTGEYDHVVGYGSVVFE